MSVIIILIQALAFNNGEHGILLIGWASTILTGGLYPAMH